jgi:hypothetical protein
MKDLRLSLSRIVKLLSVSVVAASLGGCGGGAATNSAPTPVTTTPTSSNATLTGQWQIVAHSNVNPASSILVEANFSQSGSTVTADTSSVVLIEGVPGALTGLAGECDNGVLGEDSAKATISGQTLSFTLTEVGSLGNGTSTGSATISSDGTQITSGTYQTPAACGFTADSGSLTGTTIHPFSGTFAGQLANFAGSTDAVVVTLSQSGYTLSAVGTDAGAPVTLTGRVVGATFDVTGVVQGQSREYVGILDTNSNNLRVYDNSFEFLGSLTGQSSAPPLLSISVAISPTAASVAANETQTFTSTVSNDAAAKGVTWSLSCATPNGCGSVSGDSSSSSSGGAVIYTAPATVPSSTVHLTATAVDDATKSASATITITSGAPVVSGVTVACTPSNVSGGATSACSAVVAGPNSTSQSVTWSTSGGAISAAGVLTAPVISTTTNVTVTATSTADSSKSGTFTVVVNPVVATNTPIFVGPGTLGGLAIAGTNVLVAVNDNEIYSANDQTTTALHGEVSYFDGKDVLSLTTDNVVWLDGAVRTDVVTDLPPTFWQGDVVWFDAAGNVVNPGGTIYTPTAGQDGIGLVANGALLAWAENTADGACTLYAATTTVAARQIASAGCGGLVPIDVGGGHLLLAWPTEVAESFDNGATWTVTQIPLSPQASPGGGQEISIALAADGTLYAVWQQRGDPISTDDVFQGWMSVRGLDGTWTTQANPLPPAGERRIGDFDPVVVADGSEALQSSEQPGIWLGDQQIQAVPQTDALTGPLLVLLPNGTKVVAWSDDAGAWFEEVPK